MKLFLVSDAVSAGRRVQGQKISWWEGQKGLAFLQDVQLLDGELVVSQPGLYYVYAQTYFRHTHSLEENGEEAEDRGKPLLQYVYKKVNSSFLIWQQNRCISRIGCFLKLPLSWQIHFFMVLYLHFGAPPTSLQAPVLQWLLEKENIFLSAAVHSMCSSFTSRRGEQSCVASVYFYLQCFCDVAKETLQ